MLHAFRSRAFPFTGLAATAATTVQLPTFRLHREAVCSVVYKTPIILCENPSGKPRGWFEGTGLCGVLPSAPGGGGDNNNSGGAVLGVIVAR